MLIRSRRGWELPESQATDEAVFLNRRKFLTNAAVAATGGAALVGTGAGTGIAPANAQSWLFGNRQTQVYGAPEDDPSTPLYPFARNERFTLDRPLTSMEDNFTYNNFYEFGSHKQIAREAQALKIRPWTVTLDGMVEKPIQIGIDELLAAMPKEERLYRLRCVEAWSMTVPWSGFPLAALVNFAKPQAGAKFLRMETFYDTDVAPGQRLDRFGYPWPYVEGLTLAEATNELAFMATGAYGKPLPKQMGSPLRLAVPWKYGFKSVKSVVRFTFTDQMPTSFWTRILPNEYGFWANVNPEFDHPRWSQATERVLGGDNRVPTLLYNGYADFVAGMYPNTTDRTYFM